MNRSELLLYLITKNKVEPKGKELDKTQIEIDTMVLETIDVMHAATNFALVKQDYERAKKNRDIALAALHSVDTEEE